MAVGAGAAKACHGTRTWIDIRGFDHSKTKFSLVGGVISGVACDDIKQSWGPAGSHEIQFKGTPTNCEACHTDLHGGQLLLRDGIYGKCGGTATWTGGGRLHV